jgi:hypothetical protein
VALRGQLQSLGHHLLFLVLKLRVEAGEARPPLQQLPAGQAAVAEGMQAIREGQQVSLRQLRRRKELMVATVAVHRLVEVVEVVALMVLD